ncbi:hypothetical protein GH714_013943 [Hevea brasiliensis]|uniref:50S ribosomal protein L10 n=1 Tax=Hevea brasiliensis TaxID=3981 RepID=A0A6A6L4P5_HEVBR|nr:hypothetical protein GH714_013943 [Hevea brasiliensis]
METTLLSFPSSKPTPSQTLINFRPANPFSLSKPFYKSNSRRPISVNCAISRTKKEETVETVKTQLENCHLMAAIKYTGFTVKQFQELRRSLPESSKLLVAKNTLSPAIGLVSTLQAAARDVIMVLKAYVKKLEDESGGQ